MEQPVAAVADIADARDSDESSHFLGVLQQLLVHHSVSSLCVELASIREGFLDHL